MSSSSCASESSGLQRVGHGTGRGHVKDLWGACVLVGVGLGA